MLKLSRARCGLNGKYVDVACEQAVQPAQNLIGAWWRVHNPYNPQLQNIKKLVIFFCNCTCWAWKSLVCFWHTNALAFELVPHRTRNLITSCLCGNIGGYESLWKYVIIKYSYWLITPKIDQPILLVIMCDTSVSMVTFQRDSHNPVQVNI